MRLRTLAALVIFAVAPVAVQSAPVVAAKPPAAAIPVRPYPPSPGPCCLRTVWDARGHAIGDVIDYQLSPQQPWGAVVAYRLAGGDAVPLWVTPEMFSGVQSPGGSNTLFTTPDCSGNAMFAMLGNALPLAKRHGMVLMSGWPPGAGTTTAWLWVSDSVPARVFPPAGTVFHSQWDNSQCQPIPAPGYTVNTASGLGGYPMHRVEDLMAKYQRPFYINY